MHRADECALAAADHAHAERACGAWCLRHCELLQSFLPLMGTDAYKYEFLTTDEHRFTQIKAWIMGCWIGGDA